MRRILGPGSTWDIDFDADVMDAEVVYIIEHTAPRFVSIAGHRWQVVK